MENKVEKLIEELRYDADELYHKNRDYKEKK